MERSYRIGSFVLFAYCWLEEELGGSKVFMNLLHLCFNDGCGGRMHQVVHVGKIEEGRYLVKNPAELLGDKQAPLRLTMHCTSCFSVEQLSPETVQIVINEATEWMRELREARRRKKAPLN